MIDCSSVAEAAVNKTNIAGYKIDSRMYEKFKRDCDDLTYMDGLEIESFVVQVDLETREISLKICTYFMAIESFEHELLGVLKRAKGFSFYIAGKGTPDAIAVIDIKLPGIWIEEV